MSRYQKPYIWCSFYDEPWSTNSETLTTALAHHRSIGGLAAPNQWHVTLLRVAPPPRSLISLLANCWSSLSMTLKVGASQPPSRAPLRSPPLLEDPLGEFPSLCHVRRVKPHRKWYPVAWAMPNSGQPPPRPTCTAATSPAPPEPSTPWSMIEIRSPIPIHFNKIRATDRRINEPRPWTRSMRPWTYSTRFLVEK
jgi:hypothetical protein